MKFGRVNVTKRWESGGLTGKLRGNLNAMEDVGATFQGNLFYLDADVGVWFYLNTAHPQNGTIHFENGPCAPVLAANLHPFKHFLYLPRPR